MGTPGATLILHKTSTGNIPTNTSTAILWSSAPVNTGPSGWWTSGSDVVVPWAGPYLVTLEVLYDENATGRRCVYLQRGAGSISAPNFVAGSCRAGTSADEDGIMAKFTGVLSLAADTYQVAAYQNSGVTLALEAEFASPICYASFSYLGV